MGQAVERKGLPVLLRAFEAVREQVPVRLSVIGVDEATLAPLLADPRGVRALGRIDDAEKHAALVGADLLCAPSLGGESFGMVLTEAFASGTPVVASDIPGYRGVVEHGHDGVLVPPGDALALAEALHDLALDPPRLERLGRRAGQSAERYAWPRVAERVIGAYEDAIAIPEPTGAARAAVRIGLRSADGGPRRPARRLPSLEPRAAGFARAKRFARRTALVAAGVAVAGGAWLALQRIGWEAVASSVLASSPAWVLLAIALMSASMVLRAVSWHAVLLAALPAARPRLIDAFQGTSIGVLMSATLPARLGEPSRALIVARRLGRPRELLPPVLGTLVSQTLLNLVALAILGAVMFSTVGLFAGRQQALVLYALAPFAVLCAVLVAPALLRSGRPSRSQRVQRWLHAARDALTRVRAGLAVFRDPRLGTAAADRAARRLGRAVRRMLRAAQGSRARRAGGRDRRGRGRPVRRQRDRRAARHALEPRGLPGRVRGGADERLRDRGLARARLRDHPAGGRDRDRRRHGRARARQGGPVVARGAAAHAALDAGVAGLAAARDVDPRRLIIRR